MGSRPWSAEEILCLTRAYITAYKSIDVNDPSFWIRLTYTYNVDPQTVAGNYRNIVAVTEKWYEVKIEILLFNNLIIKLMTDG